MTSKQIKEWASALPDDAIVLAQVVAEDSSAFNMNFELTDELKHFKWDGPVFAIILRNLDIKSFKYLADMVNA